MSRQDKTDKGDWWSKYKAVPTMTEHTPGPWAAFGFRGQQMQPLQSWDEAAPGLSIGSVHSTEPICRVNGYMHPVVANARLIAAAPELLEALEQIVDCDFDTDSLLNEDGDIKRARAAIAKARGE